MRIGRRMVGPDGAEIEVSGAWREALAPVFANVFDLADHIGKEFGERETCPMMILESDQFEVVGVMLSSIRAVFIRRKTKDVTHGLRSIS